MEIKEIKLKKWIGTYKGVAFEINNWNNEYDGKENWTYYLILYINRIPLEYKPNSYWLRGERNGSFVRYKYENHPVLSNIHWHGGITWYSKEHGFDGENKVVKVGCDYSHLWDEGKYYNIEIVKNDIQRTIDEFLKLVPGYKYWCCGNGKLYDLKEGVIKNGSFYSKEYFGDKDWFKALTELK